MKIKSFTFNMFGVNTYLLWDEMSRETIIVDPGMISHDEQHLLDLFIKEKKLNPKHLINTHFHIDHAFGIGHIKTTYGLEPMGNIADEFLSSNFDAQARLFDLPITITNIKISQPLKEGDTISIGDERINVIHIPGHSPGSIVLYAPQAGVLISGDVLFKHSIGRTDLAQGNYHQLITGITNKLLTLPPETIVYPGHGPSTTINEEICYNPYL